MAGKVIGTLINVEINGLLLSAVVIAAIALVVLLWKQGYRLSLYNLNEKRNLFHLLEDTNRAAVKVADALNGIRKQTNDATTVLTEIRDRMATRDESLIRKRDDAPSALPEIIEAVEVEEIKTEIITVKSEPEEYHSRVTVDDLIDRQSRSLSRQDRAVTAYKELIHDMPLMEAPVYLDADAKSSPMDTIIQCVIYLEEVNHKQGAFVMFKDSPLDGLIFPNPILVFRPQALKPVFPGLSEEQFNNSKEKIKPVPASRMPDGRWRVDSGI